jgi:hypothetical protein
VSRLVLVANEFFRGNKAKFFSKSIVLFQHENSQTQSLFLLLLVVAPALGAHRQRRHGIVISHPSAPRMEPAPAVVAADHALAVVVVRAAREAVDDPVLYAA